MAGKGRAGGVICAALLTTATRFKNAEGINLAELEEPVIGASTGIADAAQALAEAWTSTFSHHQIYINRGLQGPT